MTLTRSVPVLRSEEVRRRQLVVAKRRATALLGVVTVVFLVVTIFGGKTTWAGYVQATAEASMVGGLADWFAVVALFRHPLGIPIPHTAIIVARKDQFASTLGEFIQESFLTPDVIVERVRAAGIVARVGDWMSAPANAARLAAEVADGAVAIADLVRDEDVSRAIEAMVRERVEAVPLAPLAGRVLRFATSEGRHDQLLDAGLRNLDHYLDEHRQELRQRLGHQSPWWLPGAAEDRIFERILDGARALLQEMLGDREHHLRREFDARLDQLIADLETSPAMRERGEQLKHDLLDHPQVRAWVASLWQQIKEQLREQASLADSPLRERLAAAIATTGEQLRTDPVLAAKVQDGLESAVCYVAERFDGEIAALVSGTIARWDADETARRLELLLGPDLQYIRINGTIVGGGAGLVLHAVALWLG
jgi:uncharacterized membrane-anchored protein YjiN (DUF445 family)